MDLDDIIKTMGPWLKNKPLEEGDFSIVWLDGVATYAFCADLRPFHYMAGWYDIRLIVFDRIPPRLWGWRVSIDHLAGDTFTLGSIPVAIVPLEMSEDIPEGDGRDLALEDKSDREVIKAKPLFD